MTLTVSIAMATYNGAKFIGEQLASLAAQSVKPLELIVCDDRSSDDTVAIVRRFAVTAPFPVKIYENAETLGYRRNFMKAAAAGKGDILCFCDQDDIWDVRKLDVICDYFGRTDRLLASHDYGIFFEGGRKDIPSYFDFLNACGLPLVVNVKGCSLALRREFLDRIEWPSPASGCAHDVWVCFAAVVLGKWGFIRQPLIRHRIHATNTSGWLPGRAGWLRRVFKKIHIPPFTSATDLDHFITLFVPGRDLPIYREALQKWRPLMAPGQYERAAAALTRRESICAFLTNEAYRRPVARATTAATLFLHGAYRNGGGVLGFVKDLRGTRTSQSDG